MSAARELAKVLARLESSAPRKLPSSITKLRFHVPTKFSDRRDWYVEVLTLGP